MAARLTGEGALAAKDDEDSSVLDEGEAENTEEYEKLDISNQETKLVWKSRIVFFFFLAAVASVVGFLTYSISREVEDKDFETRVRQT